MINNVSYTNYCAGGGGESSTWMKIKVQLGAERVDIFINMDSWASAESFSFP